MVVCISAIFRFSHLGDKDFGIDEILHVYVAQELLKGHPPLLPSGYAYERSLSYSYLVAVAGYVGGLSEFALRVPSAVLGVVVVFFVYWLTQRWYSAFAGLIAAFFTAFAPIEIAHSREVRMYMLFQWLFLLTVFFFYEGFETGPPSGAKNSTQSTVRRWSEAFQIRPLFLLMAGGCFLLAWNVHPLILPSISGLLVYVLAMGGIGMCMKSIHAPIRQKYIGSCLVLLVGVIVGSLLFPDKVTRLMAVTQEPLAWGQGNADNWSYYRWILLDEYPIVFGSLTVLLISCLLKNSKIGLFVSCTFLLPFLLHSVVFPMKSYRYILHVMPLMYMAAGVGVACLLVWLWEKGNMLNEQKNIPEKLWSLFVAGVLSVSVLGILINMPWFMRTIKDYRTNFQAPHVSDVQHHNWKIAVKYIMEHQSKGDVIVSGYPLLSRHYGATQPLYFMNNAYLLTNEQRNLKNEQGRLIDYTFGAPVLKNLDDLKQALKTHSSGWVMAYQWRKDRFWTHADDQSAPLGTFPREVIRYFEENFEAQVIPHAPYMSVWRWNSRD